VSNTEARDQIKADREAEFKAAEEAIKPATKKKPKKKAPMSALLSEARNKELEELAADSKL
jgi:hypothetical protein